MTSTRLQRQGKFVIKW